MPQNTGQVVMSLEGSPPVLPRTRRTQKLGLDVGDAGEHPSG
jgi:hypothetical protein